MSVNTGLSNLSDWSFTTATAIYIVAMVLSVVSSALARTAVPARAAVGASDGPIGLRERPQRTTSDRLTRMSVALTLLGVLLHLASIATRGLATSRWPLGNMYEYVMFTTFVAVVVWLVLLTKFPVQRMTVWVLMPVTGLMVLAGKVFYAQAAPVQPALQSYWLIIHVTTASAATGALIAPGVASALYLIRRANERSGRFATLAPKLPSADLLDRVAYRITIIGFPLYTFAVICGGIWAEAAWGRFWGWDPKEVCSFVAWVVYAAYLHARATAGWSARRAAVINLIALGVLLFNLTFINLVVSGLHSYAGVD
nr:c-type cytochrome biogenesis protein CcsB [Kibdelosporangium sp. MJ126-NF4]CEL16412.1 Cytochrome c-type biogenesis protein CcsA/ResC [Kibdelosporangium sp. MJ126-NF4]CTQ90364.1 Cytochrome c-type biogenesis protein CcsA/ResC [Kibdelosporangium sp. MJ126-NF4]